MYKGLISYSQSSYKSGAKYKQYIIQRNSKSQSTHDLRHDHSTRYHFLTYEFCKKLKDWWYQEGNRYTHAIDRTAKSINPR